jgi:hypothetical protein
MSRLADDHIINRNLFFRVPCGIPTSAGSKRLVYDTEDSMIRKASIFVALQPPSIGHRACAVVDLAPPVITNVMILLILDIVQKPRSSKVPAVDLSGRHPAV